MVYIIIAGIVMNGIYIMCCYMYMHICNTINDLYKQSTYIIIQ